MLHWFSARYFFEEHMSLCQAVVGTCRISAVCDDRPSVHRHQLLISRSLVPVSQYSIAEVFLMERYSFMYDALLSCHTSFFSSFRENSCALSIKFHKAFGWRIC